MPLTSNLVRLTNLVGFHIAPGLHTLDDDVPRLVRLGSVNQVEHLRMVVATSDEIRSLDVQCRYPA